MGEITFKSKAASFVLDNEKRKEAVALLKEVVQQYVRQYIRNSQQQCGVIRYSTLLTSHCRNKAAEQEVLNQRKEAATKRDANCSFLQTTDRLTAGTFVRNDCHKLNQEGIFESINQCQEKKQRAKNISLSNQYDKDLAIYNRGRYLMQKVLK